MRTLALVASISFVASTAAAQSFGGQQMQLNGSGGNGTPLITAGGTLRLINDAYGSASSAFTTGAFNFSPTTAWSTSFFLHYAYTSDVNNFGAGGDGIAFVMQSGPATALGTGGGSMGYEGITNSLGVSFRSFWDDVLIGENGTNTITATPNPAGLAIHNDPTNADFIVAVNLSYDGAGNLTIDYSTSKPLAVPSANTYAVNVSSLGPTVRLGFTGGSGAATQLAEVDNWTFTGLTPTTTTPEPATAGLFALGASGIAVAVRRRRRM